MKKIAAALAIAAALLYPGHAGHSHLSDVPCGNSSCRLCYP
jgi:hypothetical protein